jgi:transketolase
LGEDGPTHQPIEHLTALRAIPHLTVIRPADAAEVAEAWRTALLHRGGPVALVLTRQKVRFLERTDAAGATGLGRGAYVIAEARRGAPDLVLMASGSEVAIAIDAQRMLESRGEAAVRVVSMPSHELFLAQPAAYRRELLPDGVPRIAIEAAHPMSWQRFVGDGGVVIGIGDFGASAPYQRLYREYGMAPERVVEAARGLLSR